MSVVVVVLPSDPVTAYVFQRGMMKIHPRRAKHRVIAGQTVQIAVSQHQPDAALFKFIG